MLIALALVLLSTTSANATPCPPGLLQLNALNDALLQDNVSVVQQRCDVATTNRAVDHAVTVATLPMTTLRDAPMKLSFSLDMYAQRAASSTPTRMMPALALSSNTSTLVVGNASFVAEMMRALTDRR